MNAPSHSIVPTPVATSPASGGDEFKHDSPVPHTDLLQQFIAYKVEARKFYAEQVTKLMAGEKPRYTQGLQFAAATTSTSDPDMLAAKM